MTRRQSIEVEGIGHGASPFPTATRIGPLVFSSALSGRDADTGELGSSVEEQAASAFENVRRVVTGAGLCADDIAKVTVFARDRNAVRAAVDPPWTALFPDATSRPVRHTVQAELPPGLHLQVEFIAVRGGPTS